MLLLLLSRAIIIRHVVPFLPSAAYVSFSICFVFLTLTHTHSKLHTHAVTNRNKNGKFCLLCHRHLELNFIYFAIATVIIARHREQAGPRYGRGRGKVVLSAGCFHQQQDAMLTTTVGLNNNTCRNIIFMPRTGYGVGYPGPAGAKSFLWHAPGAWAPSVRSLASSLLSRSLCLSCTRCSR